jgi:hypothetical protein
VAVGDAVVAGVSSSTYGRLGALACRSAAAFLARASGVGVGCAVRWGAAGAGRSWGAAGAGRSWGAMVAAGAGECG